MANSPPTKIDNDLQPYLNKKLPYYDIVIQKVLPNLLTYDSRFKQNITIQAFETELPKTHPWINKLSIMDKVFVFSTQEKKWLSNYHKSVSYIGEAINIDLSNKKYNPINQIFEQNIFKFYSINSATERKNLNTIISSYFRAFTSNDNVILILKTNNNINEQINKIKDSLRIYFNKNKYPPIMLINNQLSEHDMYSIHTYSDCFISTSYGEAFSRTAAEALSFGNPVISTDNIGISDYLSNETGWLIPSYKTYVDCFQPPLADIYRGTEKWYRIDEIKLVENMREAYSNKSLFESKKQNIITSNVKEKFSYKTIGQNIMAALN